MFLKCIVERSHFDGTYKTRAVIGRFPIPRIDFRYVNQILIGKACGSKESSRLWGEALRDEPKKAAKETRKPLALKRNVQALDLP